MDIHLETLPKETEGTYNLVKNISGIGQFYLAGGTALSLQIGHRISQDLDFFSAQEFDESMFTQELSVIGRFQMEKNARQTIIGILNDTKISFLGYNYPLIAPLKNDSNINIADIIDIACMKIDAISNRGAKRDFIDVYFIIQEFFPLKNILEYFNKKYASLNYNVMHVKKSLVYFEDADNEPMPKMLKMANWDEIKKFFVDEVVKL